MIRPYKQCGGKRYKGHTECVPGYECVEDNAHWWGCRLIGETRRLDSIIV
jgi:hypothetical protein